MQNSYKIIWVCWLDITSERKGNVRIILMSGKLKRKCFLFDQSELYRFIRSINSGKK